MHHDYQVWSAALCQCHLRAETSCPREALGRGECDVGWQGSGGGVAASEIVLPEGKRGDAGRHTGICSGRSRGITGRTFELAFGLTT